MSNRILTSAIAPGRKLALTKERLDFIQNNVEQLASSIMLGLLGTYTANDVIIVEGCVFTGTDPGARTMTAGVIYYNGMFYQVPSASFTTTGSNIPLWTLATATSDLATFSDGFQTNVEQVQTFVLVAGPVGGAGITGYIADYNSSTVKYLKGQWGHPTAFSTWGQSRAYYRKNLEGNIELDGEVLANGTAPTSNQIGTLPTGFRPISPRTYSVVAIINSVYGIYVLTISSSGVMQMLNSDGTAPVTFNGGDQVNISGIKFSPDNS
jgi:hypothetical protein